MSLFNFSRGEWKATIVIIALILSILLTGFLFKPQKGKSNDTNQLKFSTQIEDFYKIQELILDSLEKAKENHTSFYTQNRDNFNTHYQQNRDTGNKQYPFQNQPQKPRYTIIKLDLNSCDSIDVLNVPMFGNKRAQKLIDYRDKLGGFYSINQIKEIYILQNIEDELLLKYFYIDKNKIRKLNVNTASYQELINHPYLDSYLTKLIINYRERNGNIKNLEQLQSITHIYDDLLHQLSYYLIF